MMMENKRSAALGYLTAVLTVLSITPSAVSAGNVDEALRRTVQNPVGAVLNVSVDSTFHFDVGPGEDEATVVNVTPVIPIRLGDWTLINRTVFSFLDTPGPVRDLAELPEPGGTASESGLGDINHTFFLTNDDNPNIRWAAGPSISIPTASENELGSERWSAGPAVVSSINDGPWLFGVSARQLWSFAGEDNRSKVSQLVMQPFLTFNMNDGWYLVSSPTVSANWTTNDLDDVWTIPVGGGVGRVFTVGSQAINAAVQGFHTVEAPDPSSSWSLRAQLQFAFPG